MTAALIAQVDEALAGLEHGTVKLEIHVRDGKPWRATISRECSLLLETSAKNAEARRSGAS